MSQLSENKQAIAIALLKQYQAGFELLNKDYGKQKLAERTQRKNLINNPKNRFKFAAQALYIEIGNTLNLHRTNPNKVNCIELIKKIVLLMRKARQIPRSSKGCLANYHPNFYDNHSFIALYIQNIINPFWESTTAILSQFITFGREHHTSILYYICNRSMHSSDYLKQVANSSSLQVTYHQPKEAMNDIVAKLALALKIDTPYTQHYSGIFKEEYKRQQAEDKRQEAEIDTLLAEIDAMKM